MEESNPLISVVAPAYRCALCLPELYRRLTQALEPLTSRFEIILVNDASPENDWAVIQELAAADHRVKGVDFSRNFGQHHAISAGIDYAKGDYVVVMDADLQDQPEEIPRLYAKLEEGFDVVISKRSNRKDPFLKRLYSRLFSALYNRLSDVPIVEGSANFSIFTREVADHYRRLRERTRSFGLLLLWLGFRVAYVDVQHAARYAGTTSYTFLKGLQFAFDALVSQSDQPLRISIKLGTLTSAAAALYACWLAIRYYIHGVAVAGWTSVMVSLFFLSGVILADLGVIGLYLGKLFDEVKRRPLYVVRGTVNITK
ncbi:MAG TPA: glycosyltransferase family 2 protein [Thermoanaerobaculia bacterium]